MQAFHAFGHAPRADVGDAAFVIAEPHRQLMAERHVQAVRPAVLAGHRLIVVQQLVVRPHAAFRFDVRHRLHRLGAGQIAGGGERYAAGQHGPGDHGERPAACAAGADRHHAARVSSELPFDDGDVTLICTLLQESVGEFRDISCGGFVL